MNSVPVELTNYFNDSHFSEYPKITIPQEFRDERGIILNIADGHIGDVAIITSTAKSIRANHFHHTDWHITYLISGEMIYYWKDHPNDVWNELEFFEGEAFYTPPKVLHKMLFTKDTVMTAISKNSRSQENYEKDTQRLYLEI